MAGYGLDTCERVQAVAYTAQGKPYRKETKMPPKIIASSKFYGRPEYYNEFFETSEFKLELRELADDFRTEYWLLVQYPDRLYFHTFDDKQAAIGAYVSECESMLDFV